ncbi:MAG TPA: TIGR03667 family PPOX class F420-dependent oxidoreductase [Thermomicrobiales bacterium]|nr:TIGR03667 family PPOX class F420-dependent oxidoreductase [Thermomicrobiales bacterium]
MVSAIDTSTDLWKRVLERSATEPIIWLTTSAADGTPQPNPVWFIDEGADLIIFSKPKQAKLANIGRNPHVSCHLQVDASGGDVQVLAGTASVTDLANVSAQTMERYLVKYAAGIVALNTTPEEMTAEYSMAIRFTPSKLRGWT